jgi:hypothetical protein
MFVVQKLQKVDKIVGKVVLVAIITFKVILGSNPCNLLLVSKLGPSLNSHHNVSMGLETMFDC